MATRPIWDETQILPETAHALFADAEGLQTLWGNIDQAIWNTRSKQRGARTQETRRQIKAQYEHTAYADNVIDLEAHRSSAPQLTGWAATLERLIIEVGRIQDGWDGPGSLAPSSSVQRDFEAALGVLPGSTAEPEIEIDGSTGSITVRWMNEIAASAAVLTFMGDGHCIIMDFNPARAGSAPIICAVHDETKILDMLDATTFGSLLPAIA